jgi:hypothetical protein
MSWKNICFSLITLLFLTGYSWGQTLVDEAKSPLMDEETGEGVFIETIKCVYMY